jgi:hypothetical protein
MTHGQKNIELGIHKFVVCLFICFFYIVTVILREDIR